MWTGRVEAAKASGVKPRPIKLCYINQYQLLRYYVTV